MLQSELTIKEIFKSKDLKGNDMIIAEVYIGDSEVTLLGHSDGDALTVTSMSWLNNKNPEYGEIPHSVKKRHRDIIDAELKKVYPNIKHKEIK